MIHHSAHWLKEAIDSLRPFSGAPWRCTSSTGGAARKALQNKKTTVCPVFAERYHASNLHTRVYRGYNGMDRLMGKVCQVSAHVHCVLT